MAAYDPQTGSIVARILYDGLGLAGKTQSLRRVHESFARRTGELYVPEENARGRTLYFDWLEIEAGVIEIGREDYPLRVQLLTVPGQSVYIQRRWQLLRSADAVIAVIDSTPDGLRLGAHGVRFLRAALAEAGAQAPPMIVQANKQDLPGALRAEEVRAHLELAADLEVVETSAATGDGIREALLKAMARARDHVRAQLGSRAPVTMPVAEVDPTALYEQLRADESTRGERLEGEILADDLLRDDAAFWGSK